MQERLADGRGFTKLPGKRERAWLRLAWRGAQRYRRTDATSRAHPGWMAAGPGRCADPRRPVWLRFRLRTLHSTDAPSRRNPRQGRLGPVAPGPRRGRDDGCVDHVRARQGPRLVHGRPPGAGGGCTHRPPGLAAGPTCRRRGQLSDRRRAARRRKLPHRTGSADPVPRPGAVSDAQKAWVEEDWRPVPADRHVWVLVHQGPYAHPARLRPGHGGSERVRAALQAAARRHPIEAVFAGHEHFYERGEIDGLKYFVLGGGGAPLEDPDATFLGVQPAQKALSFVTLEVCGCHVAGKAKDIEGRVFDSFTLSDCKDPCGAPVAAKEGAP